MYKYVDTGLMAFLILPGAEHRDSVIFVCDIVIAVEILYFVSGGDHGVSIFLVRLSLIRALILDLELDLPRDVELPTAAYRLFLFLWRWYQATSFTTLWWDRLLRRQSAWASHVTKLGSLISRFQFWPSHPHYISKCNRHKQTLCEGLARHQCSY